jgi:hypothetical protein
LISSPLNERAKKLSKAKYPKLLLTPLHASGEYVVIVTLLPVVRNILKVDVMGINHLIYNWSTLKEVILKSL